MLTTQPEAYMPPSPESGERICGICGEMFQEERDVKGELLESSLQKFADHIAKHNPDPRQWTEAYRKIRSSKESKSTEKE